ncbi:MAG: exosortase A [Burkholderiales bacterium]
MATAAIDATGVHTLAWKRSLGVLAAAWVITLVVYFKTAASMVQLWYSSETFTHCFLILPIAMWLAWRKRAELLAEKPLADARIAAIAGLAGVTWLAGALGEVNALEHFALVALLVAWVPAVLGLAVAGRIAFPLAFSFFAVPFGDFLMPYMMDWTADFTVTAIRLTGIPIYREGLNFIIPTGMWSVVEACSGVRYLIASVTVGTLFAYLNYSSLRRRLTFIAVSVAVPVVANWLRAYMIVMLGHLSGNTIAVGVDHLIYGWLFFGVVIVVMFWIGGRWSEAESTPLPPTQSPAALPGSGGGFAILATFIAVMAAPAASALLPRGADVKNLTELGAISGWQVAGKPDWRPAFENTSAELSRSFESHGRHVGLFVGVYAGQGKDRRLVGSANTLVRSNDVTWAHTSDGERIIEIGMRRAAVKTAILSAARGIGSPGDKRMAVWRWYWIAGHVTSSDAVAKALTAWSRLTGRGDTGAVVIVFTDAGRDAGSAALEAFVRDAGPALEKLLGSAAGMDSLHGPEPQPGKR